MKHIISTAFLCGLCLLTGMAPGFCTQASAQEQSQEEELFFVAQKAFDDGFYDVAMRYIAQFLQKFPSTQHYAEARLLLGQCYFFKNQYLKAFEIFESLLSERSLKDATLYWLGETYFKGSDYKQAQSYYLKVIENYPESEYRPQAYYSLGWSFFDQGNYEQAISYFQKLTSKYASHTLAEDALFKIGEAQLNLSRYQDATETFLKYTSEYPKSARISNAFFYIAECCYYLDEFLNANIYYAKSAELSDDVQIVVLSKLGMGWIYLKLKKYDFAERVLNEAEAAITTHHLSTEDLLLAKGALYTETQRYQNALETYGAFLVQYPKSLRAPDAIFGKANTFYLLNQYNQAIQVYRELIASKQTRVLSQEILEKAYYGVAWSQLKQGKTEEAIATFQTIINQSNNKIVKTSALSQIGDAYQESKQFPQALMTYDRILKDFPDSLYADYAQFQQGITLLKMGDFESAKRSLQTLKANFSQSKYSAETDYYLGFACFQGQEWSEAIQYITEFLKFDAQRKTAFTEQAKYILALAYFHKKDYIKALDLFRDISVNLTGQPSIQQTSEIFIGKCLNELDKPAEAVKQFRQIIQNFPLSEAHQDALIWLGEYYFSQHDFSNAVLSFKAFIEKFPGSKKISTVYYELGRSYMGLEKFDDALNTFRRVDENADSEIFAQAQLAIADIFTQEMSAQNSLEIYRKVAERVPDYRRDALCKIAQIYEQEDDPQNAIQNYRTALNQDQAVSAISNAELLFHIGDNYELLNDQDRAVEEYLKIPYLSQQDMFWIIKAYLRIARIFENQENWEQAILTYKKILDLNVEESKYAQERIDWINNHVQK